MPNHKQHHLSPDRLDEFYLNRNMTEEERTTIRAHLCDCRRCREALTQLHEGLEVLRAQIARRHQAAS